MNARNMPEDFRSIYRGTGEDMLAITLELTGAKTLIVDLNRWCFSAHRATKITGTALVVMESTPPLGVLYHDDGARLWLREYRFESTMDGGFCSVRVSPDNGYKWLLRGERTRCHKTRLSFYQHVKDQTYRFRETSFADE